MRRVSDRSITITTVRIAYLAVLLSCGAEPTTPPVSPPVTPPAQPEISITGAAVPGMASYDQTITDFMRKFSIPGGAVAVTRDGKLIYARGFGYADVENKTLVQPDALFRIASVSKPITSVNGGGEATLRAADGIATQSMKVSTPG
jgi:CubicO group peptidase (beta-lactamase class C family)